MDGHWTRKTWPNIDKIRRQTGLILCILLVMLKRIEIYSQLATVRQASVAANQLTVHLPSSGHLPIASLILLVRVLHSSEVASLSVYICCVRILIRYRDFSSFATSRTIIFCSGTAAGYKNLMFNLSIFFGGQREYGLATRFENESYKKSLVYYMLLCRAVIFIS